MDSNKQAFSDRLQTILSSLTECKLDYSRAKDECQRIREINIKLEIELKEAREIEKSHRNHLHNSREMIENLQETVSELVYLKRNIKKLKDEFSVKDSTIEALENEKQNISDKYNEKLTELRSFHEKQIEDLTSSHDINMQQVRHDAETQIAQFTCLIEELRAKIKEMEAEHSDKMNLVVLEYEEKLLRSSAQITQLQDQHAGLLARTDANMDAYRRRLEELEEKLKQSQFKQYLAQSNIAPHYESHVERPYSVNKDYIDSCSIDSDPVHDNTRSKPSSTTSQKLSVRPNTLQVTYYGNKTPHPPKNEKKGPFNIVKKRKLYNDKDFQDF